MRTDNIVEQYISLGIDASWYGGNGNVWVSPSKPEHIEHILRIRHVRSISLPGREWVAEVLDHVLAELPELDRLDIMCTYVRGSQFAKIKNLQNLQELSITRLVLDADSAVASVSHCKSLRSLSIESSLVSPDGLAHLSKLVRLSYLAVEWCPLGILGWRRLGDISSLRELVVTHESLAQRCLEGICGLKNLERLCLAYCNAPPIPGFASLARIPTLRIVELSGTNFSKRSLDGITALTSLRHIILNNTELSRRDVNAIRKALPYCSIEYSQRPKLPDIEDLPSLKKPPEPEWQ